MVFGKIKVDQIESSTQVINVDDIGLSSGVSDGNKGDITVSSSGTVWSVNDGAVALNQLSDVTLTSPSDGQSLSYNASTGQWVNSTPAGSGTVTSVGFVAPTGFSVSGSPVTGSGNITLSFAAGYSLPTTASQTNWDTAYSERLYWDGGATGLNAATGRTSLGLAAVASTGAYSDLSGTPTVPAAADATPQPLGTAAIGISTDYAREDHVHAMPSAADVGADPAGTASSAIGTHEAAADPHPGYALESNLGTAALLNVGTTTGTVAAGDDARFTTDLSYTAGTRLLASSTGADVTLPLFTSTEAGLTPLSGGGTTNFLRADGTWAAPPGGSGITDGDKGDITVSASGTVWSIDAGVVSTTELGGDITTAGKALLDDADAAAQRTTLGLGTAATQDVGTSAGNVVQLDGSAKLPAVDGSQLINLPSGGGGGLTHFVESEETASPNATVPVDALTATDAGYTDIDVALVAKGTGATLAQVPDGTAAGGNKRGWRATDWQKSRLNSSHVASGSYSVIGGGESNTASASYSAVAGGSSNRASTNYSFVGGGSSNTAQTNTFVTVCGGSTNIASGQYSFIGGGKQHTASAEYCFVGGGENNWAGGAHSAVVGGAINWATGPASFIAGGRRGFARGITGYHVFPACYEPIDIVLGCTQSALLLLGRQTTDATPTVLTSNTSAASTTNQVILPNNAAYYFKGSVIAGVTGAGDTAAWSIEGAIKRGADAASTTMVGSPTVTMTHNDAGAASWTVTVTADTTNGGIKVEVTGAAATTIRWVCKLETTEMTY